MKFIFLSTLIITIFLFKINAVLATNINWVKINSSNGSFQVWDKSSLKEVKPGIISINTKYIDNQIKDAKKNQRERTISYQMEIDCTKKIYRDLSINGIKQIQPNWLKSNDDVLINETIKAACEKT